jgi:HD-like signal output (HDOD) protein
LFVLPETIPTEEGPAVTAEERSEEMNRLPWAYLRLPPFPQVAVRVMGLAIQENVQLHQLSDLISSDAAFASEVLTIANSVLYAPRYPASSILQAVAVLGANTLKGMCVTVGVRAYLGRSLHFPAMRGLWRHNLACALIAQQLAACGSTDRDSAYTAGIVHDVGRFALAVIQPQDYAELLESHCGAAVSILERERELFGWDHCETGHRLIADWKLPAEFDAVVREHHAPPRGEDGWGLAELVKISCRMADSAGFPAFPGCEATPYAELLERLPDRERRGFPPALDPLIRAVANGIHALESV